MTHESRKGTAPRDGRKSLAVPTEVDTGACRAGPDDLVQETKVSRHAESGEAEFCGRRRAHTGGGLGSPRDDRLRPEKQNAVMVVGKDGEPQRPIEPKVVNKLLKGKKARRLRVVPFAIQLTEEGDAWEVLIRLVHVERGGTGEPPKMGKQLAKERAKEGQLGIDPGARKIGLALVYGNTVEWAAEVRLRGRQIHQDMVKRAAIRRGRRGRNCPHRKQRWHGKEKGRLAPSLMHSVLVMDTWVGRLTRWARVGEMSFEKNAFDTRKMAEPEVQGKGYQKSPLVGLQEKMNLRNAVFARDKRTCGTRGERNIGRGALPPSMEATEEIEQAGALGAAMERLAAEQAAQQSRQPQKGG